MSNIKKFRIIKFKSKPVLSAKSISKSFDGRMILRKIDLHLNQGDSVILETPGGGGYGVSKTRPIGHVMKDFKSGFISADIAKHNYCVVISSNGLLDKVKTEKLRKSVPHNEKK